MERKLMPIEVAEKAAQGLSITAGCGTGLYGLMFNEWLALAGFLVALASVIGEFWFKRKRLEILSEKRRKEDKENV